TYSGSGFAPAVTRATVQAAAQSATLDIASTTATRTEIRYGTSPTALNKRLVDGSQGIRHQLTLTRLQPSTTYYYTVSVTGPNRKTATSAPGTCATPAVDVTPPTISDVGVYPMPDGTAAASWQTDENADSTLLIGQTPDALAARHDGRTDDTHTVGITGLR